MIIKTRNRYNLNLKTGNLELYDGQNWPNFKLHSHINI